MAIYYENPKISEGTYEHTIELSTYPRPWIRYFARMIDMWFGVILIAIAWVILSPTTYDRILVDNGNDYIAALVLYTIWLVVESMMVSTLGTTFGKWIFSSKVISVDGRKLKFSKALLRNFSMFFYGLGLMIPIVSLFALVNSFKELKNQSYGGFTKWDIQTKSAVITAKLKPIKIALLITFCIASSVGYSYYYVNQANSINANSTTVEQLDEWWTKLDNEATLLADWGEELSIKFDNITKLAEELEESRNSDSETEYSNNVDNYNSVVNAYNQEQSLYETRRLQYNSDVESYTKKYDEVMGTTE